MMKLKWLLPSVLFLICLPIASQAQHPLTDDEDPIDRYLPPVWVSLAGEVSVLTYGATISFPVFWIKGRVKMVPLAGVFWNSFSDDGSVLNPAVGGKLLVYFRRQYNDRPHINSFYAGIGGMSSNIGSWGQEYNDEESIDVIVGYDYTINSTFQIAPEIRLGVSHDDELRLAAGVVFHIGE